MTFIQIIEYQTARENELGPLLDEWLRATDGRRAAVRSTHTHDRLEPNRFVDIVEFPSYEAALANNELPATQALAAQLRALCTSGPQFRNLDVLRDDKI